jgi:hypothetical protein
VFWAFGGWAGGGTLLDIFGDSGFLGGGKILGFVIVLLFWVLRWAGEAPPALRRPQYLGAPALRRPSEAFTGSLFPYRTEAAL